MAEKDKIKITYATRAVEITDEDNKKSLKYEKIHPITTGNAVVVKDKKGNLKTLNKALEDISSPPEVHIGEDQPSDLETIWINPNGIQGVSQGTDVPNDDKYYARRNKLWEEIPKPTNIFSVVNGRVCITYKKKVIQN